MLSAIKLVISENGKLLESLSKDTSTQPSHLIKNLEDFQQSANAALTKLIETNGESGTLSDNTDSGEDDDEESEDEQISPRKRRK
ncbi:hypothetical protein evm_002552 [Chilo suppressalis]|nr:hypothetical protein evm_002552 [Chilo suppressalis]